MEPTNENFICLRAHKINKNGSSTSVDLQIRPLPAFRTTFSRPTFKKTSQKFGSTSGLPKRLKIQES